MQNAISDFTSTLQESISGIRVLKAYGAEAKASAAFEENTEKFLKSSIKHKKIITIIPAINEVFAIVALCVVLFVGGTAINDGQLSFDDLWLFLVSLFSIMSPITTVIDTISKFQRGIVSAGRIFKVLEAQSTVINGTEKIENFRDKISIRNLSFAYADIPILKDVSFDIEKGKKVAFVGPSGSGKSTMLDLLIRFYDPADGTISIDNQNIKNFDTDSYRSLFGIVSQETILFNDTIAGNIRFGKPEATIDEVTEAAKNANAFNYISATSDGFGTNVGDRGTKLSGGERQRLAIARALVRNPEILVFDEATSALDSESEKIVQDAINKNLEERTAVLVAHRLATIINCDLILVFDRGKIVERGSHAELLAMDGIYKKLYDIQFAEQQHHNKG
jgi:subfamily B ATP-binding cassette protein MsbA